MSNRKIYIVGGLGYIDYINWMEATPAKTMEDADAVLFTGGEDINPAIYNQKPNPTTYFNVSRDEQEIKAFNKARKLNKPLIGVCRGSQMLCGLSGGVLVQNQDNPNYIHPIDTFDNNTIVAPSTHHQAQVPWNLPANDYKVLGWTIGNSSYHEGETEGSEVVLGIAPENKEVEICYYRKTNALAIQPHLEMFFEKYDRSPLVKRSVDWARDLLNKFLAGSL